MNASKLLLTLPLLSWAAGCASGGASPTPAAPTPSPSAAAPAKPRPIGSNKTLENAKRLARENKLAEARAEAEKAVAEVPTSEEAHLLATSLASMAKDSPGAKAAVDRGLAAIPESAELHHVAGMLALEANQMEAAAKLLEESVRLFGAKRSAQVLADCAYAYLFVGRLEDAERLAAEARKADPKDFASAFTHGEALLRLKRFADAAKAYSAAAELSPDDPLPRTRLAAAFMKAGDFAAAAPVLEQALKKAPDDEKSGLHAALAQAYLETKRPKEAVAEAELALSGSPNEPNLLSLLADAQEAAGDKTAAKKTRGKIPSGGKKK